MNELVKPTLKVDLDVQLPEIVPVKHNLGIIEQYAEQLNEFYSKLVFTPEQYSEAKDERAKVNKLQKTIADNRKEIVKEFKQPIDDFEATSKRIEKLLESAANTIGASIEQFDLEQQKIKEEKINKLIEAIRDNFILNNEVFEKQLREHQIEFDKRWFNKTYKDSDLENDIENQFREKITDLENFKTDAETIITFFNTINVDNVLNKEVYVERYRHTRDVNLVINSIKDDYEAKKQTVVGKIDVGIKEEAILVDPFAGLSINNVPKKKYFKVICDESQVNLLINFAKNNNMEIEEEENGK